MTQEREKKTTTTTLANSVNKKLWRETTGLIDGLIGCYSSPHCTDDGDDNSQYSLRIYHTGLSALYAVGM